ncbi:MAG: hypothetical protein ABEI74_02260 [Candidatus Pacearchaeota archaeon]
MARRRFGKSIKKFNLLIGTLIFALLIGTSFSFGLVFGLGFVIGFALSIYNKTLEKKPLIPIFIFLAALVLRYALNFVPSVLDAQNLVDFIVSAFFLIIFLFVWWKLSQGKWMFWKK